MYSSGLRYWWPWHICTFKLQCILLYEGDGDGDCDGDGDGDDDGDDYVLSCYLAYF